MTLEIEEAAPGKVAEGEPAPAKAEDVETIAREMGWKPETEWKGDPPEGGFATAAEFIRTQGTRAKNLDKEMKKLRVDTDRRIRKMEDMSKKQRDKEIAQLHSEYDFWIKRAVKEGDEETFDKLTKEKAEKVKEAEEAGEEKDAPQSEEEWIEAFKPSYPEVQKRFYSDEGHGWILDDDADPDAMRLVLDYVDSGVPFTEALSKADKALRRAYPDRYEEDDEVDEDEREEERPARKRAPVLSPGGRGNGGHVSAASRLTPAQREIGNRFVKEKLFGSLEEYAEQRLAMEKR